MLRKLLNSALASAYSHKDAISFRAIRANVQKLKAMEGELFASRRSFVNFLREKFAKRSIRDNGDDSSVTRLDNSSKFLAKKLFTKVAQIDC